MIKMQPTAHHRTTRSIPFSLQTTSEYISNLLGRWGAHHVQAAVLQNLPSFKKF